MCHLKIALLLALATVMVTASNESNVTILSESGVADPTEFPWHATVFVVSRGGPTYAADGALISSKLVVTVGNFAAVGLQHGNAYVIFAPRFGAGPKRPVENIVVHPNFKQSRDIRYNIGVFRLRQPVRSAQGLRLIALAPTVPPEGQIVRQSGFTRQGKSHNLKYYFDCVTRSTTCFPFS